MIPVPHSYDDVLRTFGDIRQYINKDGTIKPEWEAQQIVRIPLPTIAPLAGEAKFVTKVSVHRLLAGQASALYGAIYNAGLWATLGPYGGGYNYRPNRNDTARPSLHSFGIAFDWDPNGFPNGSPLKRNPQLAEILRKAGWMLGEDFEHTKDPMHFQYATGC